MKRTICFVILLLLNLSLFAQYGNITMAKSLSDMYDWDKYPTYTVYKEFMQTYADKYPEFCRLDTVGYSVEGRLLMALKIFDKQKECVSKPRFFISAAIHGDELTGSIVLLRLIDTLLSHKDNFQNYYDSLEIYICPFMNPDGTWQNNNDVSYAIRYNSNYVDLNRNYKDIRYPYKETSDGEMLQQENKSFIAYQNKEKFNLSCNLHTGSEVFNFPFDSYTSYEKKHAHHDWFTMLGNDFVSALNSKGTSYFKKVTSSGIIDGGDWYVIGGSHQDWSTYFAHCPEVTIELSENKMPKSQDLPMYWEYLRSSMLVYTNYAMQGFSVCVYDSADNTIMIDNAQVFVNDYDKDSSQTFTDERGYAFRVFYDTVVNVTISKSGYESKTLQIQSVGHSTYNVALKKKNVSLNNTEQAHKISVSPNPAKEVLVVNAKGGTNAVLYDGNGKQCIAKKINSDVLTLHLSQFSSGIYILEIQFADGERQYEKIIKQ